MNVPERCAAAGPLRTFSTDGMAGSRRIEFWNEVVCSTFTALTVNAPSEDFNGRMRHLELADMRLAVADSSPAIVTHSRAQASRCQDAYFMLHLQLSGRSFNQQTGREVTLSPGCLTLFDSTRPYSVAFSHPTSILVARIPRSLMREYVPCPEALTLIPLSSSSPASWLAARFMRDLWRKSAALTSQSSARHVTEGMMSLIAAAYASTRDAKVEGSPHAAVVRIRLLEHIESNLRNPDLTPALIARMGHVSTRYLHLLFEQQGESVRRYVQRRRLEECARVLRDSLRSSKSVTEIACEQGFNSTSQFCRAFRERYGVTPTEYRTQPHVAGSA
ncbi:MAG TPA: helix-turn-helix domain-containing protein [Steroidobacteraceae bacterium]